MISLLFITAEAYSVKARKRVKSECIKTRNYTKALRRQKDRIVDC